MLVHTGTNIFVSSTGVSGRSDTGTSGKMQRDKNGNLSDNTNKRHEDTGVQQHPTRLHWTNVWPVDDHRNHWTRQGFVKRCLRTPCFSPNANANLKTLLDLCVTSMRQGHAHLIGIVAIEVDDPRREALGLPLPPSRSHF